jgi:hypothetical protein
MGCQCFPFREDLILEKLGLRESIPALHLKRFSRRLEIAKGRDKDNSSSGQDSEFLPEVYAAIHHFEAKGLMRGL